MECRCQGTYPPKVDSPTPVVVLLLHPMVKMNRQLHLLSVTDCSDTVKVCQIDDAQAPDFHMVGQQGILPHADEVVVTDVSQLHRIVADQAMPAFDELQGGFALADPALSGDQVTKMPQTSTKHPWMFGWGENLVKGLVETS